ncbi:MAG: hypothetical protein DWQ04_20940 [Chloroflexi bacterium]|nr:MAG: hypothetical protein DWQ04_20940 [Chloroflexota bacterium]
MIILGVIVAFLADFNRLRYGNLGALIWIGVTFFTFVFGLLYYAQFVLPKQGHEGWAEGFELLVRYYTSMSEKYLGGSGSQRQSAQRSGPRRRGSKKTKVKLTPQKLPPSFTNVRAGIVPGHKMITLLKGNDFSRAAGPGFVLLYRKERIDKIIDLRPQKRSQDVIGTTRDGIPVETNVSVNFRVQQEPARQAFDGLIYPIDKDSIFPISNFTSVDENGSIRYWDDQLAPLAAGELSNELSTYNLDELQHTSGEHSIKNEIKQRIQRKVSRIAAEHGLELMGVGIGHLKFPESITQQRIKTWQAEWQRKIEVKHAAGDAEATRRIKQARARAQIEIIERITQSIDAMQQQEDTNLTEIITLRMIEALEEATTNDSVQALIPQQVMTNLVLDASNQMQSWLSRQTGGESS